MPPRGTHQQTARPATGTNEQGHTLQTLIITAIAVLLAVAAGVVIIAITQNAQNNLEGAPPNITSPCKPWEIHNLQQQAAGAGGGKEFFYTSGLSSELTGVSPGVAGVTSSAVGCLAPCYLTLNDRQDETLDNAITPGVRHPPRQDDLKFDTSNRPTRYGPDSNGYEGISFEVRLGVVSSPPFFTDSVLRSDTVTGSIAEASVATINETATKSLFNTDLMFDRKSDRDKIELHGPTSTPVAVGLQDPPVLKGSNLGVRALADPGVCDIYDKVTGEVFMSSLESRVGQFIP